VLYLNVVLDDDSMASRKKNIIADQVNLNNAK
jgi:hypothetical protein